jgi:CubicO group peptidase (beta-lactamase class C family)
MGLLHQTFFRLALTLSLLLASCALAPSRQESAENPSYQPVAYDDTWPLSTPAEQGLDPKSVANAYREASKISTIYSLLVVKNGTLVAEQYFHGKRIDRTSNVASVTKSYLSALYGIALSQGYLKNLDQKMMDYFPEYAVPGLDQAKYDITIRQLLQMKAGYPFDSTSEYYSQLGRSGNYMRFVVEQHPLINPPDSAWNYSSASAHILAGILTKAVGMPLDKFAAQYLYDPLNIRIRNWGKDPQGYNMGGAEMSYIPRDMAKFGELYLNHGVYDGKQLIPAEWIEASTRPYSATTYGDLGDFKNIQYGYLWWCAEVGKSKVNFAWGHGGNFIVIVPELDMLVVSTADPTGGFGDQAWKNEKAVMDLISRLVANN